MSGEKPLRLYVWQTPKTGQYYCSHKRREHLSPIEMIDAWAYTKACIILRAIASGKMDAERAASLSTECLKDLGEPLE
jgi:hypothetical protein